MPVVLVTQSPRPGDQVRPFGVPFMYVPARTEIRDGAGRRQRDPLRGNGDLVWCWPGRCRL
jgi:formyltetrahydrofolate deformylase